MNIARKEYTTRTEKRKDFIIGFIGWLVGNALFAGAIFLALSAVNSTITDDQIVPLLISCCQLLPLVANLGALVYLSVARKWIALGMLGAFGALLALVVLAGVIFAAYCFVAGAGAI